MSLWLKQSTAVDVAIGPFVDSTDGFTAETALTLSQADIRLKKNAGNWAQKNQSSSATHEENGYYEVNLNSTDTDTLGILILAVNETGALPVWKDFLVVAANVYDSIIGGGDTLDVQVTGIGAGVVADSYQAKVWLFDDDGGTTDRYVVCFFKNGEPYLTPGGITSPTIQVYKVADGTDLVASTALTEIGTKETYRYSEATNRIVDGVAYIAHVTATIDGSSRAWVQPVGRDS